MSRRWGDIFFLRPEILIERTPDGGVFMIATEERLDPTRPELLRRAYSGEKRRSPATG
jgi:hypothetical protein